MQRTTVGGWWWTVPSYQRFSSGSVSSGAGARQTLTASTNARETVRAAKEVLMKEKEEEEAEYLCGGVTTKVAQGWNNTGRTPSSRPVS